MASATPTLEELKSYKMLDISIVFLSLSAITVILRIYVRAFMIRSFGWDDWLMLITWFLYSVLCGLLMNGALMEINQGVEDPAVVATILTLVVCIFGLYILTGIIFKLSLAVFFLRVVNERWHRQVIIGSVAVFTVIATAWLFVAVFQCGNPANFATAEAAGTCLPFQTVLRPLNYIHGILNALTDWIFAIIPIFVVRSAQMPKQARVTVCTILALGVLGSICSIVRLAYVDVIGVALGDLLTHAPNYAIVSIIELGLGITAACLATLRPLFSTWLDRARTGISTSRNKSSRDLPPGLDGSKAVHGSYVTSDKFHAGSESKEDGVVTVTKELQVFTSQPSDAMELHDLQSPRGAQHRGIMGRKASQSSEESLLQVV